MRIVGFDPGLATLGYGVIDVDKNRITAVDYGAILTPKDEPIYNRLRAIEAGVNQVLDKFSPDEVAMEELFFVKNITNGIQVAHARGVLLLTVAKRTENLFEYTPMQIKLALTGYGMAKKRQVQEVVKKMLKLNEIPRPDDAADALAVAITHANTKKLSTLYRVK